MSDGPFLSRWSRRKTQARKGSGETAPPPADPPRGNTPVSATAAGVAKAEPPPLPPVESLTPDSDFTPFLREGVDEALKRQALRTLFRDPRFNVMDGLDVYIDDFSKPDPLPEGWLEKLNQYANLSPRPEPESPEAAAQEAAATSPEALAAPGSDAALETPTEYPAEPESDRAAETGSERAAEPDTPVKEGPQR